jgi:hypothetical protein
MAVGRTETPLFQPPSMSSSEAAPGFANDQA